MNNIAFPGLGLDFNINRVAFSVFGKNIYWYAIIIVIGFLLASYYGMRRCKQFGLKEDNILDMLLFAVPSAIIFARLYYVVFNFAEYRNNPIEMLYIWNGGIAIYGAIIGAVIAAVIYCKVTKTQISAMFDIGALGLLIGQAIGRWGNFVNAEAYGYETDVLWRMEIFDVNTLSRICVHPTFLYESLWNLIGFVLLHFKSKNRKFSGEIFLLYVAWYGLGRAIIEGMRSDSLYLFGTNLRISQFIGVLSLIVSVIVLVYFYLFRDKEEMKNSLKTLEDIKTEE